MLNTRDIDKHFSILDFFYLQEFCQTIEIRSVIQCFSSALDLLYGSWWKRSSHNLERFSLLSHERRLSQRLLHWPPVLLLCTRNGALIMKGWESKERSAIHSLITHTGVFVGSLGWQKVIALPHIAAQPAWLQTFHRGQRLGKNLNWIFEALGKRTVEEKREWRQMQAC